MRRFVGTNEGIGCPKPYIAVRSDAMCDGRAAPQL